MNGADLPGGSSAPTSAPIAVSPRVFCALLLAIHAILLTWAAAENSATFDEPAHLAAGAAYWRWADFSIYSLSPPLLRLWAAAPAVLAGAEVPDPKPAHQYDVAMRHLRYVDDFTMANPGRLEHLIFLSRLGMIPISCLTALLIFRWAGELYGASASVAACALYCFNPSILAHASLVTTDLGTTTAMLWASWIWWRFCRRPTLARWLWLCLALTALHLCKFTAVLIWSMMAAMAVPFALRGGNRWRTYALAGAAAFPMTVLLINAAYGFHDSFRPLGSFTFLSSFMQHVQQHLPAGLRVPFPGVMVEGFDAQKFDTSLGYPAFLFGDTYAGARWYYYPDALLCKTPVALLALMLIAAISLLFPRRQFAPDDFASPWSMAMAPIVFLAGVLIIGDVNIGTRYILPALPFALILTSRLWILIDRVPKFLRRIRDGLVLMAAVEAVLVGPWFLSYINFALGGPDQGVHLLSNSDFDWGQGLIALRDWMRDHSVPSINLVYFGYIDPADYGVSYKIPNVTTALPYVAFSSFYVQGMSNRIITSPRHREGTRVFYYAQLQEKTPVAVVADTIFIYDRRDVEAAALKFQVLYPSAGH